MRLLLPLSCLLFALTACNKGGADDLDEDGYSAEEDCDDENADIFPGAEEVCDGVDNDCNDEIDEAVLLTFYGDADGDGYGDPDQATQACEATAELAESDQDCDDANPDIYPGAPEDDCTDPVDYNCDGSVQFEDADSDGWAACEDCDDANPGIHPEAEEVCDGLDNDCSGEADGADAVDGQSFYLDSDEDGYGDPTISVFDCEVPDGYSALDSDCDDTNATVNPGAEEICDGLDTDCNNATVETLYPSDYTNLQLAIDSGEPEICVEAGTHSVNLNLDGVDTFTLTGAGGSDAVFLDGGGSRVIDMGSGASNIVLSGLTLQNVNESGQDGLGILANACSNVTLNDIVVTDIVGDSGNETGLAMGFTQCDGVLIQDSAVHNVTATYDENTGDNSYGLVGLTYSDNVIVDGLEIYDSEITGFSQVWGSAFGMLGDGASASVSINDLKVHDVTETGTTSISYGMVLTYLTTDVDASNISVKESTQEGNQVTSAVFIFQTLGNADVTNVQVIGNTSTTSELQYGPQFWAYYATGDTRVSNILSAGNTNVATGSSYSDSVWLYQPEGVSEGTHQASNITVYGNTALNTEEGSGGMLSCNGVVTVSNSTVSGNSTNGGSALAGWGQSGDLGLEACSGTPTYNNVYDNGVNFDTIADFTGSDGNIGVEPGFVDVSSSDPTDWDLTLASGSGLIDKGDPAVLDADGSTSDIGAHGGPLSESWQ
ncbi:MAG: hypothetical protein ACI9VR_001024 [Cognaticolwellia sp.]|jgi:hypothetical protein